MDQRLPLKELLKEASAQAAKETFERHQRMGRAPSYRFRRVQGKTRRVKSKEEKGRAKGKRTEQNAEEADKRNGREK